MSRSKRTKKEKKSTNTNNNDKSNIRKNINKRGWNKNKEGNV